MTAPPTTANYWENATAMRTLGIVGGLGPDSTVDYYLSIIAAYRRRVGDDSSPSIVIDSLDVRRGIRMLDDGALEDLTAYIAASLERLAKGGASLAVIAANTPHIVFDQLEPRSPIPLISIVRATRDAALAGGARRPALLGTGFTMSGDFYPASRGCAVVAHSKRPSFTRPRVASIDVLVRRETPASSLILAFDLNTLTKSSNPLPECVRAGRTNLTPCSVPPSDKHHCMRSRSS